MSSPVNIDLTDDHGHVNKDTVTISRGTEIVWSSAGHGNATIVFDGPNGSPFASNTFDLRDKSVSSGPAIRGGSKEPFKYTVHGEHGVNDPVVVVDP